MTPTKAGVYPGLSLAEYLAIDAANHSTLRRFARSAAHAREEMVHPPEPTAALAFGQAVHAAVLEPHAFSTDYAIGPEGDRRTKAGKDAWTRFELDHPGALVLGHDEGETIQAIVRAIGEHELARDLCRTARGLSELTVLWDHALVGLEAPVRCKGRIDRLVDWHGTPTVVDLKTTTDASPKAFARACANFGYHSQAAFYLDGLRSLSDLDRRYVLCAVEKERPHGVACYELDAKSLQQGRVEYERWLWLYAEARRTNVWPGYDAALQSLSIPRWAFEAASAEEVYSDVH